MFEAIHRGDPSTDLITIRYLDALTQIADGRATKIFLPVETSGVLGSIGAIKELWNEDDGSPRAARRSAPPAPNDEA